MEGSQTERPNSGLEAPVQRGELSDREREILRLVATGASNKEIALQLAISPNTVKVHLRNVFAKISVTSRTEAAMFAIREGLVRLPGSQASGVESAAAGDIPAWPASPAAVAAEPARPWVHRLVWLLPLVVALAALLVVALPRLSGAAPTAAPPAQPERWATRSPLPVARSGMAVAAYADQVYVVGGETAAGVTGATDQYDTEVDQWTSLAAKPVPVADVGAVAVGGLVYVPGGRLASGSPTDLLEVYDPRANRWVTRAPIPTPLSGYALVAFEGKLYLFGGWDGQRFVNTVYVYDPVRNAWSDGPAMPTARGFACAVLAGASIYVIGGTDGAHALAANEAFSPDAQPGSSAAWQKRSPLPAPRARLAAAGLADIVHVVGGDGADSPSLAAVYFPVADRWQLVNVPGVQSWSSLGAAAVGTELYLLGGVEDGALTADQRVYEALYSVSIPIIQ